MKILTTLVLALLLMAWQPAARAQACGDTIATSITLTADLHCTTGWTALYVPVGYITIHLNGHTLSGDPALQGIHIADAAKVRIVGPGRITGFWTGVNATRADELAVDGVSFEDIGSGVTISDTMAATVKNNDFRQVQGWGVYIIAVPGSRTTLGAHAILDNQMLDIGGGISICGHPHSDNLIKGNKLQGVRDYGIHLYDASNNNQVQQNELRKVELAGIVLRGSSKNKISGNLIDYGYAGMSLIPQFTGSCMTGGYSPVVAFNLIEGNSIFQQSVGISLGLGISKDPQVVKNRIYLNKLYYDATGLYFREDAHDNDATGNAYFGTPTPVVDTGSGNTY
ncbi:right-handed parallel beta-helix repeat-containing protein [Pseudoxanthomonas wuyuanensis]|uniref:Parallel beta-helix repeat (Two copies) n=1 Tax=Pseudoxanthomonas wuyuanensis TaxID=1073196 RepID=A0A286DEA4_9GAMM|nr:right-handed parallel beta-helix repeat-containing protein [Pseudoxanthomonas wuyuanensis]KAF1720064.1 hypothetical protein CSC75_13060 [Pseudoxanthomonas wuyuanensis]SOD56996.1 parallel beta-helix repeat (two copies) [Pseudoxanthomonas wuyuanensis]